MTDEEESAVTKALKTQKAHNVADALKMEQQADKIKELTAEVAQLKGALTRYNNQLESELKADSITRIKVMSKYNDSELENLSIEELQAIEQALTKSKGLETTAVFKSIRAGDATAHSDNLTVGNLYGKSRKEILEMGGDF